MLDQINNLLGSLTKSERKVAEVVLDAPNDVLRYSIQTLASVALVSEPTIMRFCRSLGTDGFQDFKLKLAQSLVRKDTYFYRHVGANDTASELSGKLIDSAVSSLVQMKDELDCDQLDKAIRLFTDCERVEFYGSGGSGVVAADAQLKFFRLGKPAIAYSDPHIQHAAAALLDESVLVIAISASGLNKDLIHTLNIARGCKARIVAITAANTPISRLADVTLSVNVVEDSDIFSPIKSRLAQIVLLDILAVGAGVKGGDVILEQLARAKRAIDFKFVKES